jgi:hypothetical protein
MEPAEVRLSVRPALATGAAVVKAKKPDTRVTMIDEVRMLEVLRLSLYEF